MTVEKALKAIVQTHLLNLGFEPVEKKWKLRIARKGDYGPLAVPVPEIAGTNLKEVAEAGYRFVRPLPKVAHAR